MEETIQKLLSSDGVTGLFYAQFVAFVFYMLKKIFDWAVQKFKENEAKKEAFLEGLKKDMFDLKIQMANLQGQLQTTASNLSIVTKMEKDLQKLFKGEKVPQKSSEG